MNESVMQALRPAILGAFLALFSLCSCDKQSPAAPDSGHSPGVVYKVTTRIVSEHLKAPSTAKFPSFYDDGAVTCLDLGTERYELSSYVDSQNSFGAMIRTTWVARVSVLGDSVTAEELAIGDEAIATLRKKIEEKKRDAERAVYFNSPQYKADAERTKAEYDAQQKQIAADRFAEEQRVERESLALEKKGREAESLAKVAEEQKRMAEERAAAWTF